MTHALLAGLLTGFSLIVAIGAQNAYVLRVGLTRQNVFVVVLICTLSDIALISLGVGGIGTIVRHAPQALEVFRWFGVAFLAIFALRSFRRATKPGSLSPSEPTRTKVVPAILATLAFTFLNPHVYLDTVVLEGSIANQFGSMKWWFALGAAISSTIWFTSLGFGSRYASRLMSRPVTWRILDIAIGVIVSGVAVNLAFTALPR